MAPALAARAPRLTELVVESLHVDLKVRSAAFRAGGAPARAGGRRTIISFPMRVGVAGCPCVRASMGYLSHSMALAYSCLTNLHAAGPLGATGAAGGRLSPAPTRQAGVG